MCGIAGWYCWGEQRPKPGMAKALLMANLTRGRSASGVAFRDPESGKVHIRKAPGPADGFIRSQPEDFWDRVASSPIALIHARATTKGSEKENENNHPVTGFNWTVVHNGHVNNDDDLWEYYKKDRKRFAEVDTSAIPLVLSLGKDYEDSMRQLTLLGGSVSCAMWNSEDKNIDTVALVRLGGNSVYLFFDIANDILFWSSAAIASRVMPCMTMDTIRFPFAGQIPEGKLMIMKPGEPFTSEVFKIDRSPFSLPHVKHAHSGKAGSGNNVRSFPHDLPPSAVVGGSSDLNKPPRLRWDAQRHNPKDKPVAVLTSNDVKIFNPKYFNDLAATTAAFTKPLTELDTAYGKWSFYKQQDGKVVRMFRPRKAVRKFFLRNFRVGKKGWPQFPIVLDSNGKTEYDLKLWLEDLILTYQPHQSSPAVWTEQFHMCPWCGAYWYRTNSFKIEYRCPACQIQSMPYDTYKGR